MACNKQLLAVYELEQKGKAEKLSCWNLFCLILRNAVNNKIFKIWHL